MHILDIGGGFAGGSFDSTGTVQLGQVPLAVNTALATFFPDPSVKVSGLCWVDLTSQFASSGAVSGMFLQSGALLPAQ